MPPVFGQFQDFAFQKCERPDTRLGANLVHGVYLKQIIVGGPLKSYNAFSSTLVGEAGSITNTATGKFTKRQVSQPMSVFSLPVLQPNFTYRLDPLLSNVHNTRQLSGLGGDTSGSTMNLVSPTQQCRVQNELFSLAGTKPVLGINQISLRRPFLRTNRRE